MSKFTVVFNPATSTYSVYKYATVVYSSHSQEDADLVAEEYDIVDEWYEYHFYNNQQSEYDYV